MTVTVDHSSVASLVHLHFLFQNAGNEKAQLKIKRLLQKTVRGESHIAFCGHFSAGKSSMINAFINMPVLPSSPIPTSANLVEIKKGQHQATIESMKGTTYTIPEAYELDDISHFMKDGQDIASVTFSHPSLQLDQSCILLDTPGVDSVDDAHQRSTESGLYLADLIVYVMDCNHVLSEVNIHFLQAIQQQNKPVVLVVNQIDKLHHEEISIETFRQDIRQAFQERGVDTSYLFLTSVHSPETAGSEWHELCHFLHDYAKNASNHVDEAARVTAKALIQEHLSWEKQAQSQQREQIADTLEHLTAEELEEAKEALSNENHAQQTAIDHQKQFAEETRQAVDRTAANAHLFPYETRELAAQYLASLDPQFKTGLFRNKKKVLAEQDARLDAFHNALSKALKQLVTNLRDLVRNAMQQVGIKDERLVESVFHTDLSVTSKDLADLVQSGATANATYVLKYRDDIIAFIRQRSRQAFFPLIEEGLSSLQKFEQHTNEERQAKMQQLEAIVQADQQRRALDAELDKLEQEMIAVLDHPPTYEEEALNHLLTSEVRPFAEAFVQQEEIVEEPDVLEDTQSTGVSIDTSKVLQVDRQKLTHDLTEVGKRISALPGTHSVAERLYKKAERLNTQRFTVALFGAFSAGKSSFANALLGGRHLPVSPQPTTASIIRVQAPNNEHHDGEAVIHMKDEAQLLDDAKDALQPVNAEISTLEELSSLLAQLNWPNHAGAQKAFVEAIAHGLEQQKETLGTSFVATKSQYMAYTAEERTACFVESVDVYVDCPLTNQGVVLVDTPGADSMNSRHTSVAFDYIKNADAILFVTYYNHAFSKADRQFLEQLGKVKDAFALDKMFFIVNAKDLAKNDAELEQVQSYVKQQLIARQIQQPRLYAISSRQALSSSEETRQQSGLGAMKQRFNDFIQNELASVVTNEAIADLRFVKRLLSEASENARLSEEMRQEKADTILKKRDAILHKIQSTAQSPLETALKNEEDQLLYHVKQRSQFNTGTWFKQAFHPGLFAERSAKEAFQAGMNDFLTLINEALAQELRATALRLEQKSYQLTVEAQENWAETFAKHFQESLPTVDMKQQKVPEMIEVIQFSSEVLRTWQKHMKNAKYFSEGPGREQLQNDLFKALDDALSAWQKSAEQLLTPWASKHLHAQLDACKQSSQDAVKETAASLLSALSPEAVEAWQKEEKFVEQTLLSYT
ncbi:hypothetical protein G4V62_10510 [Bacillaceae bacterium SIJ1]|uniref:dynamin family protein n=1 Tax=Litoribacterium kuwaitense TaxID=1398745 RepID=UPI0013EE11E4|nr:dynamin family protein [Litoribacterium kuwaitense]NGP45363.1 hypothetical protein [Litoribacterium kuwaitense]